MAEDVVLTEIDARGIATLTLNRPQVNNAYNGEMIEALVERAETLGKDDAVRIIVVRGNGRHFQAGADLRWIDAVRQQSRTQNLEVSRRTANAVRGLNEIAKPTQKRPERKMGTDLPLPYASTPAMIAGNSASGYVIFSARDHCRKMRMLKVIRIM